jgi:hypothetical protein
MNPVPDAIVQRPLSQRERMGACGFTRLHSLTLALSPSWGRAE